MGQGAAVDVFQLAAQRHAVRQAAGAHAVLARELGDEVKLLVVANPCFGLDFAATSLIRGQIVDARNQGTAVLLISEDLDEVLELSDRVLVMSEGKIVYETPIEAADRHEIGHHMAGHH